MLSAIRYTPGSATYVFILLTTIVVSDEVNQYSGEWCITMKVAKAF